MASVKYIENSISKFNDLGNIVSGGFNVTKSVAEDIEETEKGREIIKELRDIMVGYAEMERDIKQYKKAAEQTRTKFLTEFSGEKNTNFDFLASFEDNLKNITANNENEDLTKNKEVNGFLETVWTQHYGDDTQQPTLDTGEGNEEDEEDVLIDETQDDEQRFICPITKTLFEDPVKSIQCQHTYSRKAIEMMIQKRKEKSCCPIPGCNTKISITDLEENHVIAYELRKRNKK